MGAVSDSCCHCCCAEEPIDDSTNSEKQTKDSTPNPSASGSFAEQDTDFVSSDAEESFSISSVEDQVPFVPITAKKRSSTVTFSNIIINEEDLQDQESLSSDSGLAIERIPTTHLLEGDSSGLFVAPYKSAQEMYDSEQIDILINIELPDSITSTLGHPISYIVPTQQPERGHIERDLRKIKVSLLEYKLEEAEQRKYAKLCILKYYDLLTSIYKRYCKIGRDTQWMTMFGWISLLRDCGMVKTENDEQEFIDIYHSVYQYHHKHHHVTATPMYGNELKDTDPWTGVWVLQKHRNHYESRQYSPLMRGQSLSDRRLSLRQSPRSPSRHSPISTSPAFKDEHYKFRKIGDRKVIGCKLGSGRLMFRGWLNRSDFKKAKLRSDVEGRKKIKRTLKCRLIPSDNIVEPLKMRIKWENTKIGSPGCDSGVTKLFKFDPLNDDDADLPRSDYVGLCRHEFFDALLCVARLSDEQSALYLLFNELVVNHLHRYIFKTMVDLRRFLKGKEIEQELQGRLHADASLIRLYSKYSSLQKDTEHIEEDAWCAMAEDMYIVAKSMDKDIWKFGGRPADELLIQCFVLSKPAQKMDEEWIDLSEFIRCLIYFTAALFRDQSGAEYEVLPFEDKLDLVLKWCHRMDAQSSNMTVRGAKVSSPKLFRSNSLIKVKRRRGISLIEAQHTPSVSVSPPLGYSDITLPTINVNENDSNASP